MNPEFKFRHANEIAGAFVILAVALFVLGVVFAGKSQGWFEPRFTLYVIFDTAEGSFGLQEGAPVLVRNTVAGRVGPVQPTPDGKMGASFVIKDRFRPFITEDAVAKIKKKFGLAGDAYVDIERGRGPVIQDEATIACVKDEELIETAQRMLDEVRTNMMPILEQVEVIITSVASILKQVDSGQGIAGAAVGDSALRDDVKTMVSNLEGVSLHVRQMSGQVDSLLSNEVSQVLSDAGKISAQGVNLMRGEVPLLAEETLRLQRELTRTLVETRRTIQGLQHHWLLRKYMPDEPERLPLSSAGVGWMGDGVESAVQERELSAARAADDPEQTGRYAYNLAVLALTADDTVRAHALLNEIRFADRQTGGGLRAETRLLEAELCRRSGDFERALALADDVAHETRGRSRRPLQAESRLLRASVYADAGNAAAAREALADADRAVDRADPSPLLQAARAGVRAGILVLEGDLTGAAAAYADQAGYFRDADAPAAMTRALRRAGELYARLGLSNSAATHYLRAAVSLDARGERGEADGLLELAFEQARTSGDPLLMSRIETLRECPEAK